MTHEKVCEIRWRDMDAFGHVNHGVFTVYLEEARDELFERYLGGEEEMLRLVIRRLEIDFLQQLTQADGDVRAVLSIASLGTTSIRTEEKLYAGSDGRLVATASCVLVRLDAAMERPEAFPEAVHSRLEAGL